MRFSFFIFLFAGMHLCFSQNIIEKYVREGIAYHDAGQYQKALRSYEHALYLNPNSSIANYEMAMTFSTMAVHDSAILYAERVIDLNDGNLIPAFIVIGNTFNALGDSKAALKTYREAVRRMGRHYVLLYNLGLTHFDLNNDKKAVRALKKAIRENPRHASTHLLLGKIMYESQQPAKSLLALYYFLLMEPNSSRSADALGLVQRQLLGQTLTKAYSGSLTVERNEVDSKNDFYPVDLMLYELRKDYQSGGNKDKDVDEQFLSGTESFFKILGKQKQKNKRPWWRPYVSFFNELVESGHMETFCYFISQSGDQNAEIWLKNNTDRLRSFNLWLRQFDQLISLN